MIDFFTLILKPVPKCLLQWYPVTRENNFWYYSCPEKQYLLFYFYLTTVQVL